MVGPVGRRRMRVAVTAMALPIIVLIPALASFAASPTPTPTGTPVPQSPGPAPGGAGDQVVLLGRVVVPRGQAVGEVVVFSGRVVVDGIVRGDVVVVDGPITVGGQVSGSVIALDGPVRLLATAQVGGDVLAHDRATVAVGAVVHGTIREHVAFNLSAPLRAVAAFVSWLAVAASTLLLGLLIVWIAPRALERTAEAGRTAPWASAGWGLLLAIGLPILSILSIVLVLGIPFGLALLLSTVLLALVGAVVTAHTVGRALVDEGRGTTTAFLAGWAIASIVGVIPYVSGGAFVLSSIFGMGAIVIAMWRARGSRRDVRPTGRHRPGGVVPSLGGDEAPGL